MKQHFAPLSRRQFLRGTSTTVAAAAVLPGHILGLNGAVSPNNKLNVACIGVGGRGSANVDGVKGENIVALCDVDSVRAGMAKKGGSSQAKAPAAKIYQDFRKMLDEMNRQIDAVTVSTPDHTHAVALVRAIKMGKHVYSEKPLAHSVHEIRAILKAA